MQNTRQRSIELGITDWFMAHREARKRLTNRQRGDEISSYVNFLWPVSLEYFSPFHPTLLAELQDPRLFSQSEVHLARDGLVPLLWFFHANPKPTAFKGRLLVEESLAAYVPLAWRAVTGSYALAPTPAPRPASARAAIPPRAQERSRKLLLVGVMMDTYCSVKHLERKLEEIVETIGPREIRKREIAAFLPGRFDGWGTEHRHDFHLEYMARIHASLGTRIKALTWGELEARASYEGFDVVDLNEGLLWSDNFILHRALSRGARPLLAPAELPESEFVGLSPHYGMRVSAKIRTPYALAGDRAEMERKTEYLTRFDLAMKSEANLRFPWPAWFSDWARARASARLRQHRRGNSAQFTSMNKL